MTADHEPDENEQPSMRLGFKTPFGIVDDPDDLPPEARAHLEEQYRSGEMPDEVREALGRALRVGRRPAHRAPLATASPVDTDPHHAEAHRAELWEILDQAFPQEPHLWAAGEALFGLSAANPSHKDDEHRRSALEDATMHLQHHAAQLAAPMSPEDQLVEKFRSQLGGF